MTLNNIMEHNDMRGLSLLELNPCLVMDGQDQQVLLDHYPVIVSKNYNVKRVKYYR